MAVPFLPNFQSHITRWRLHYDMDFPYLPSGGPSLVFFFYFVIPAEAGIHSHS